MRNVYTPSELNHEVKIHLEAGFSRLWIEGEISNLSRPASGHLYFSLKDKQAQISCALFRSNARGLGFKPENGQLVRARGRVSLYEARGNYQLIADSLEEAGEGQLQAAIDALRKKLELEGLFKQETKQALPRYPTRVAVITSASGAVIRDIIRVLERRWPLCAIRLYPVSVQGTTAPAEIVKALKAANRHAWGDAIIVGRGGGSLEDLLAFNDEQVARSIHSSELPVISAVGHESDYAISDLVADVRAPTPSAAAELLTPDSSELRRLFKSMEGRLAQKIQTQINQRSQGLDHVFGRLTRQHPERRIQAQSEALGRIYARYANAIRKIIPQRLDRLSLFEQRLKRSAAQLVPDQAQRLQSIARTLHAVSPLPTLERGYAVVTDAVSKDAIQSVKQVTQGQKLQTRLLDGRVVSSVEEIITDPLIDNQQKKPT